MDFSSLRLWLILLLSLNISDVLTTVPMFEANPVTLYMWGKIGLFAAACLKIGLVFIFGALCLLTRKLANQGEWEFARRVLLWLLKFLVAFYIFVVAVNLAAFFLRV